MSDPVADHGHPDAPRYWLDGPISPFNMWGVGDKAKGGIEWHFDTRQEAERFLAGKLAGEQ